MKIIPAGADASSAWDDGLWVEKPGHPTIECCWVHPPPKGFKVPEFEFEEGHDKNKNEPGPVFFIGSHNDCHIRIDDDSLPHYVCRLFKQHRTWIVEGFLPNHAVHVGGRALEQGEQAVLRDSDLVSLGPPPTDLSFRAAISEEDNWYLEVDNVKDFPNKYPPRFPFRGSMVHAPKAPEELKRLAWQTDQMRRRSEEDQVRVGDWSAFSQYVKRHFYKHGIECVPWATDGRGRAFDAKPPNLPARAYPDWIAALVARERQQPGIDPGRPLPYASSLAASGLEVQQAPELQGGPALVAAAATPAAPEPIASAASVAPVNPRLRQSLREWLEGLDDSLFLMQYHDRLVADFDSLEQIHEIYFRSGELNKSFFDDTGIKKLGHRRIFEKWFKDLCK